VGDIIDFVRDHQSWHDFPPLMPATGNVLTLSPGAPKSNE
jgi:hypothetical protein